MNSSILEELATQFPRLDPAVVADVWRSSQGNMDGVRDQLSEIVSLSVFHVGLNCGCNKRQPDC